MNTEVEIGRISPCGETGLVGLRPEPVSGLGHSATIQLRERLKSLASRIERGEIKCLSTRQPYAHHILYDGKDVENRTWGTKGRGWIMLHASKRSEDAEFSRRLNMPLGAIVGVVRITDSVTEMASEWFYGPHGFVLAEAVDIDPVYCNGQLGFFRPDADTCARVAAALRARAASVDTNAKGEDAPAAEFIGGAVPAQP